MNDRKNMRKIIIEIFKGNRKTEFHLKENNVDDNAEKYKRDTKT